MESRIRCLYIGKLAKSTLKFFLDTGIINFYNIKDMLPGYYDGPSHTLLEVINNLNGKAPLNWQGFRILTEK